MNSIKSMLNTIKTALETDIPVLLETSGLNDFAIYAIGTSRNPHEKGLFVYKDSYAATDTEETLTLIVQAQLTGVNIDDSMNYEDVLLNYFRGFSPRTIGATSLDRIESDTWPIERTQGTFVFIFLTFVNERDSCDND